MTHTNHASNERTATDQADAVSPNELTRFQLDLLFTIAGYEQERYRDHRHSGNLPHGLAIRDTLGARYDTEIHHGRLYPNLDTLVDLGLVEKVQLDRRTNAYELTDDGWELLHRRAQWILGCIDGVEGGDGA